ncbi:NADH dehydrogenase-like protein [Caulifigura coniformis]|uniref:NADH:ubiquinone reductase (non-electrogenic) n=1 Tax=Caulifigura coniformis TaxID=2527983 RepID=A0A517SFS2_9PLAN|nr:NAD(P)/FAD-dependent oxidoreductase [Caulifigura coniformis]QDT54950.1 NADH dehydrogenase-like protein [Caulifigura coniformis]
MQPANGRHRVVILGGGFGGLRAAKALAREPVEVTLIDQRNFHLFQPLLYQVATGGLSPANIAAPLRSLVRRQRNCRVILGKAIDFNLETKEVVLEDERVPFDTLIVSAGAKHSYFGNHQWERFAPGLKTIEDATEIRRRVLSAFERAERVSSDAERARLLRFIVVGAGPTGVELAGTLIEIARHTLKKDFRRINPAEAHVLLIEAGPRLLPAFDPDLSEDGAEALRRLGVDVRLKTMVVDITDAGATVKSGDVEETLPAATILWAAGVQGAVIGEALAKAAGIQRDRAGRLVVQPDFTLPGHPDIFVIGDLSTYADASGKMLPGVAPAAMQAGQFVASVIAARLSLAPIPEFHFKDPGSMATIGRGAAVVKLGNWKFSGFFAWLTWLFVHLLFLVQFQNRLLVLMQWAWNYVTFNRSARLITDTNRFLGEPEN